MNTIEYLKSVYGYGVPIFLKDIRIGKRSNSAIRKELSRAVKSGEIKRKADGVYSFEDASDPTSRIVTFDTIVNERFVSTQSMIPGLPLEVFGYYSGQTFLNQIGISQQVPATIEITTNNTSCKRIYQIGPRRALLRKGRIEITSRNYKALQFFDMLSMSLSAQEIEENKPLIMDYIRKNLSRNDYATYIKHYPNRVNKIIIEKGLINAFT